eukprot:CAMPEP_0198652510 /NCGR_PEP_ID=MMETSP1467-20131203/6427_1 /TAXON_ID=1462469 /ORGANISM="unid. sp., Strain CCMP2135" /LENGTH=97 /DNA_ID=CAMNT_0044388433 /DNA_START=170 /DNA_END=460 /DNA_ORIENTATION=+
MTVTFQITGVLSLGEDLQRTLETRQQGAEEGAVHDGDDRDDVVTGLFFEELDFLDDAADLGVIVDVDEVDDELRRSHRHAADLGLDAVLDPARDVVQ